MLKWLRKNGWPWDEMTCWSAARGGHLEVLQWARANGCPWNEDTCKLAAIGGHFEVLQWARANGCPWSGEELYIAAEMGHEAVVRALIELGSDINKADDNGYTPLIMAVQKGHDVVVRALIEADADIDKATMQQIWQLWGSFFRCLGMPARCDETTETTGRARDITTQGGHLRTT